MRCVWPLILPLLNCLLLLLSNVIVEMAVKNVQPGMSFGYSGVYRSTSQALVFCQAAVNAPSSSWAAVVDLRCNGFLLCY